MIEAIYDKNGCIPATILKIAKDTRSICKNTRFLYFHSQLVICNLKNSFSRFQWCLDLCMEWMDRNHFHYYERRSRGFNSSILWNRGECNRFRKILLLLVLHIQSTFFGCLTRMDEITQLDDDEEQKRVETLKNSVLTLQSCLQRIVENQ